jgi:rod shape-determining protein MreD
MIRAPTSWLVYGSFALALIFMILPLPAGIDAMRPFLLAMFMAYWSMEVPHKVGIGTAFFVGLLADLLAATLLGEHALRLVVLVFLVQRFRARLRFFPLWQQALALGLLLGNDQILLIIIHWLSGATLVSWKNAVSPLLGMLLWPWLYVLLDMVRLRARERA